MYYQEPGGVWRLGPRDAPDWISAQSKLWEGRRGENTQGRVCKGRDRWTTEGSDSWTTEVSGHRCHFLPLGGRVELLGRSGACSALSTRVGALTDCAMDTDVLSQTWCRLGLKPSISKLQKPANPERSNCLSPGITHSASSAMKPALIDTRLPSRPPCTHWTRCPSVCKEGQPELLYGILLRGWERLVPEQMRTTQTKPHFLTPHLIKTNSDLSHFDLCRD